MAYNLYQVQMANAWTEVRWKDFPLGRCIGSCREKVNQSLRLNKFFTSQRIDKENKIAERFWADQAQKLCSPTSSPKGGSKYAGSVAPASVASGGSTKTLVLKERLERLEKEYMLEKEQRLKVRQ
jgi:hypothetical protein